MPQILVMTFLIIGALPLASAQKGNRMPDERGRELVGRWMANVSGSEGGLITSITDESVVSAFPLQLFNVLQYRQYPVARVLPESLTYNNLLLVQSDGRVELLSGSSALEPLFRSTLGPVKNKTIARTAVKAWLRLTQEFHQDGFFEFFVPDDSLAVEANEKGIEASGKVVVSSGAGNRGGIRVHLTFDRDGKLTKAIEHASVIAGLRPN